MLPFNGPLCRLGKACLEATEKLPEVAGPGVLEHQLFGLRGKRDLLAGHLLQPLPCHDEHVFTPLAQRR